MSCHVIYYAQGRKMMRPVSGAAELRALRDTDRQRRLTEALRADSPRLEKEEADRLKRQLLQLNYSCLPTADGGLKGARTASGSVGMDIDFDPADPDYDRKMSEVPQTVIGKRDELGLLLLERSARKGYHVVFRRHFVEGLAEGRTLENQEANLRWASGLLGVRFDEGAKDITRVFFATTADPTDLLYLADGLFDNTPPGPLPPPPAAPAAPVPAAPAAASASAAAETAPAPPAPEAPAGAAAEYMGITYTDLIAKYWELYNEGREPRQGDRNVKTYELALTLRSVCDYSQEVLERVIPRYDGFAQEEWRETIANALKEPRKGMPYRMRQVLQAVRDERRLKLVGADTACPDSDGERMPTGMPQRPRRMPALLRLLSSKVPDKLKAMVEEAVWPALCAHLHDVTFRYIDGVTHEANICSPLIGRQSSGKGHVNLPIEYLLADITARDEANKQREQEWRVRNQCKGASKDRQPRPQDIVIQRLDDDLTPAALAQSLIDAERNGRRRIITKVDEIELLNKVGNGRNDTVGLLVRYGFDTARWGQRRVGLDCVNGSYTVRWVWNASCTLKSLRKFIGPDWIANGSLSRLNVNALILPKDDHEMPVIGTYDERFAAELKVFVDRLNAASGEVDCPQANRLAQQLVKEHERVADLCESEGYRILSYRAVVIGWLKALILYIANGQRWDTAISDYVAYSVRRDLWLKMYFFGRQIEEEFEEEDRQQQPGPQNMLTLLPQEFTYQEFLLLRQHQGRQGNGRNTLRTWVARGYIARDEAEPDRYIRLKG